MIVTRFAPSPTGLLHLGHAYAARMAAVAGERVLLRIEDIDATRCRPAFEAAIFEDLAWLGLAWEKPVLRQSTRFAAYRVALERLKDDDIDDLLFGIELGERGMAALSGGSRFLGQIRTGCRK